MNEININIEGYNVNGICVGCLNYKRKMSYCGEVNECLRLLGNIDVPDGLSVQMCWECVASARATSHFRSQILCSYDILIQYSRQHTFMNNPADLSKHAATRLSQHTTVKLDFGPQIDLPLMKPDDDDDEKKMAELPEIKEEVVDYGTQTPSPLNTDYDQDHLEPVPHQPEQSSDEELQLSELKRKKEKKTRGRRKKARDEKKMLKQNEIQRMSRKLKNLPEDLVELIKLDEEGMHLVRSRDVTSAAFLQSRARCEQCVLAFASERLKSDHMLAKHRPKGDKSVQCDVCHGHFLNADNLTHHRERHRLAYLCRACGHTTQLKRSMAGHAATHRERRATCRRCKKEFDSPSKLSYHRQMCHDSKPQCDCCGKVFANKMTLRSHIQSRARLTESERPGALLIERVSIPCKGCDKVFPSKKSYRAHVVIHNGLQYPCPICGKLFQWKRNLARHLRNHADRDAGALHECKMCSKRFSSRDCLNNHMRLSKRHVPPENYSHECEYCGKKFATKWCMIDHVDWEHLKKIKYQCAVCHKAFKTAKIMVAHMNNIHEGKRLQPDGEHLCDICGKSYKTVKRLKGHVHAMHTTRSTSKNFKCKLCPATFTWQTSIYKHMKCMHQGPRRHKPVRAPAPRTTKPAPEYGAYELAQRMHYYEVPVLGEGAPIVPITGQQT